MVQHHAFPRPPHVLAQVGGVNAPLSQRLDRQRDAQAGGSGALHFMHLAFGNAAPLAHLGKSQAKFGTEARNGQRFDHA